MKVDDWLDSIAPNVPNTLVASAIGKHPSAVTRWRNMENPIAMEDVVALARHFNASVLTSLRDLGFLTAEETTGVIDTLSFRGVGNEVLLEELMKRSMAARFRIGMLDQQARAIEEGSPSEDAAYLARGVRHSIRQYRTDVIGRDPDADDSRPLL